MIAVAVLGAALVAALAVALVADRRRARSRPVRPVARRVLDRYDADGRRVEP